MDRFAVVLVTGLVTVAAAACSGSVADAGGAALLEAGADAAGPPSLERDAASAPDGAQEADAADASEAPDVADAAPYCPPLDKPACTKAAFSDSACSISAPPSLPYGCQQDIGTGCTELSSGNAWCCPPPPSAPTCSLNDPYCVSIGAAACGLTSGCSTPHEGCRGPFKPGGGDVWCCEP